MVEVTGPFNEGKGDALICPKIGGKISSACAKVRFGVV